MAKGFPRIKINLRFGQKQRDFFFHQERIRIGQGSDMDLVVAGEGIAKRHLQIRFREGVATVEDLGSESGTWLGDNRIKANMPTVFEAPIEISFGVHRVVATVYNLDEPLKTGSFILNQQATASVQLEEQTISQSGSMLEDSSSIDVPQTNPAVSEATFSELSEPELDLSGAFTPDPTEAIAIDSSSPELMPADNHATRELPPLPQATFVGNLAINQQTHLQAQTQPLTQNAQLGRAKLSLVEELEKPLKQFDMLEKANASVVETEKHLQDMLEATRRNIVEMQKQSNDYALKSKELSNQITEGAIDESTKVHSETHDQVKVLKERAQKDAEEILKKARDEAQNIVSHAEKLSVEVLNDTKHSRDQLKERLQEKLNSLIEKAQAEGAQILRDAQGKSDALKLTAHNEAKKLVEDAKYESDKLRKEAKALSEALTRESREKATMYVDEARSHSSTVRAEADALAHETLTKARQEAQGVLTTARQKADELIRGTHAYANDVVSKTEAESEQVLKEARERVADMLAASQMEAQKITMAARQRAQDKALEAETQGVDMLRVARERADLIQSEAQKTGDGIIEKAHITVKEMHLAAQSEMAKIIDIANQKGAELLAVAQTHAEKVTLQAQTDAHSITAKAKERAKETLLDAIQEKHDLDERIGRLRTQIDQAREELGRITKDRDEVARERDRLFRERIDLSKIREETDKTRLEMLRELEGTRGELDVLRAEVRAKEERKAEIDAHLESVQEQISVLMGDAEERRRLALLDAEQAHRRKLQLEEEILNFDSIRTESVAALEKLKNQTSDQIVEARDKAYSQIETEVKQKSIEYLEERARIEAELDLVRKDAHAKAQAMIKQAEEKLAQAEKAAQAATSKKAELEQGFAKREQEVQILTQQKQKMEAELKDLQTKSKEEIKRKNDSELLKFQSQKRALEEEIEGLRASRSSLLKNEPPTTNMTATPSILGLGTNEAARVKEILHYDDAAMSERREARLRQALIGGVVLFLLVLLYMFPVRWIGGLFSSSGSASSDTFADKVKKARERPKFQPKTSTKHKPNYTDNVLYTTRYVENVRRPEYENQWHIELNRFLTQDLRLSETVTHKFVAAEVVLVKELETAAREIYDDERDKGIDKMRAIEVVFSRDMREILRTEANYTKFVKFAERFYNARVAANSTPAGEPEE